MCRLLTLGSFPSISFFLSFICSFVLCCYLQEWNFSAMTSRKVMLVLKLKEEYLKCQDSSAVVFWEGEDYRYSLNYGAMGH